MRIILGAPCSGKGSQSQMLARRYHFHHVSAGALLRKKYPPNTPQRDLLDKGQIICLKEVNELVEQKLIEHNFNVLLDGYPRDVGQAEFLKYLLKRNNVSIREIFVLGCPKDELVRRTSLRTVCEVCESIYMTHKNCCGRATTIRSDDNISVLYDRYDNFMATFEKLQPILQGPFYFINGCQLIDQISRTICEIVDINRKNFHGKDLNSKTLPPTQSS